ncbi:MAG: NAD+ synthase, partial [Sphingobacterium sp.]|nr:NAD+ synthase [Sphingobacterium sp.]
MKIALAQLNYHIGNFEQNEEKIIKAIADAKEAQANLIVFAELAIGGYPAKDLLRNAVFLDQCQQSLSRIAVHCDTIDCIIGAPIRNEHEEGKPLSNAAIVITKGQITDCRKKSLLPDYDVFDEYRYFEPNRNIQCIELQGKKIALTICEDLWDNDHDNSY